MPISMQDKKVTSINIKPKSFEDFCHKPNKPNSGQTPVRRRRRIRRSFSGDHVLKGFAWLMLMKPLKEHIYIWVLGVKLMLQYVCRHDLPWTHTYGQYCILMAQMYPNRTNDTKNWNKGQVNQDNMCSLTWKHVVEYGALWSGAVRCGHYGYLIELLLLFLLVYFK